MSKKATAEDQILMDRRNKERRNEQGTDGIKNVGIETERRNKKVRRRQIDPTTCERDYNEEEIEFMQALDKYKRTSGRMFPTCSEILEVIRGLGYVRLTAEELAEIEALNAEIGDLDESVNCSLVESAYDADLESDDCRSSSGSLMFSDR